MSNSHNRVISSSGFQANSQRYGNHNSGRTMDFIDAILPAERESSKALNLLPTQVSEVQESKGVWVGKIPTNTTDALIQRILKACGPVESWKRSVDSSNNLKAFGFCYYEDIRSVMLC